MKKGEYITAGELIIEPVPYIEITSLEITAEQNSHTFMCSKGKINVSDRDKIDFLCRFGTEAVIKKREGDVLFKGLITNLSVEECAGVLTVTVCAVSYTILLDQKKKTRPFHDIKETIEGIIRTVTAETPEARVIVEDMCNESAGQFIMQYDETDWEFIKRMASHSRQNVFPDVWHDYPAFYVGKPSFMPEAEIADEIPYTLSWNDQIEEPYAANTAAMKYTVCLNDRYLRLGECVKFKGATLYVRSLHVLISQAVLKIDYELCAREGLSTIYRTNPQLSGKEVNGLVKRIERDSVKVQILGPDGNGNGEACWFPYSTVYASSDDSGWYCMPEPGDRVRIRFPDENETSAYAISSVSGYAPENERSDRMRDYAVRYIRNRQGMEVIWTPDKVSISANGASLIDINRNGRLFISSDSRITIHADKDVTLEAGDQIHINGGGGIRITCGAKAEINMDGSGLIELKGNEVHTN